jgi:hypothetical protein
MAVIYIFLFLAIMGAAFSHAVMDCITFLRIHMALHPLADGWHLAQYVRIGCYISIGYQWPRCWSRSHMATLIVSVCAIVLGRYIWDAVMSWPGYWLSWDTTIQISTGWEWLDHLLGFHW